jgi:ABC-type glycerol-3-phosphate transport system substrate-binding protein
MTMFKSQGRRWRLRAAAAIVAVGLTTAAIAGCTSGKSASASTTTGKVNWWGWSPTKDAATTYIAAFNKKYPHIKVNYKLLPVVGVAALLRPALASGPDGPDVFDITPGPELTSFGGYAADLTSTAKSALGANWKSRVSPSGVAPLTTSSGKLAALSMGSIYGGPLWINQDLFTKYGVAAPKTLTQWVKDCAVFKSHGVGCFTQGVGSLGFSQDTLQSIANSVAPGDWTKASKGEIKWTDPAFVKTLTIWKSLFSDGIMEPGALGVQQYPDASNDFLSGKYAMIQMGTWYMPNATKSGMTESISAAGVASVSTFTALPIAFPNVGGHQGSMFGEADYGLAVNSKSKVKGAATTFVSWMTTSKTAQQLVANQLNDFPALNGVNPDWNTIKLVNPSKQQPVLNTLIKETSTVNQPREALFNNDMQQAVQVAATTVAAGQATPEQAVQTLQSSAVASGVTFK